MNDENPLGNSPEDNLQSEEAATDGESPEIPDSEASPASEIPPLTVSLQKSAPLVDALVRRLPFAYPGRDIPLVALPFPDFDLTLDDEETPEEGKEFELEDPPHEFTPEPRPEDLPPFNPKYWPSEPIPPEDPISEGPGLESKNDAALFVSDFHLSDGAVGDDYLVNHLVSSPPLVVGNTAAGPSRAALFAAVLAFVTRRLNNVGLNSFDIVLNGDTIDQLELIGRGTAIAPVHAPLFGTLAAARAAGNPIFYLRGNHDFVVPPGPWTPGVFYANANLTTLAEHGDFWDPFNWPPGLANPGSRLVTTVTARLETLPTDFTIFPPAAIYELAGLDNARPFNAATIAAFFQRRVGLGTRVLLPTVTALIDAATAALKAFGGMADDRMGLFGALLRRLLPRFFGWLQVQGHTHVPVSVPTVYHNTGTWTAFLIAGGGAESVLERFPFLLVYRDPATGARVEEYFIIEFRPNGRTVAVLSNRARVNRLRRRLGYRNI